MRALSACESEVCGLARAEKLLVGALDCAVDQHSLRVGCFKSGCSDSKLSSSNPPRWGRLGFGIGSDLSLAGVWSSDVRPPAAHASLSVEKKTLTCSWPRGTSRQTAAHAAAGAHFKRKNSKIANYEFCSIKRTKRPSGRFMRCVRQCSVCLSCLCR